MPTTDPPPAPSAWDTWSLWLSVGYALLLLCAALAITFGWTALEDALDSAGWFR